MLLGPPLSGVRGLSCRPARAAEGPAGSRWRLPAVGHCAAWVKPTESYGKAGWSAPNGEQEHVNVALTSVFGNAFRDAAGGKAWITSVTKPSSSNATIDIPVDQALHPLARGAGGAGATPGCIINSEAPLAEVADRKAQPVCGGCHALVMPAFSFSITWLIVKLAGRCEGGNSTNDWAIWAT